MSSRRKRRRGRRHCQSQTAIRRYNLWQADARCHWCGQPTRLPGRGQPQDLPSTATVDHVHSRFHPARGGQSKGDACTVLACHACNQARCRRENLLFRDFLRCLTLIPGLRLNNAERCAAFRAALALTELPDVRTFPAGLSGRELAEQYLRSRRLESQGV